MKRVRSVLVAGLASTVMLVAALVGTAPRAGAAGSVGTPAKSPSGPNCPWLDQSLPVSQRVAMLLPKMTLADKITLVEGQGTSKPYVFYMAGVPKLCIPPMGEEDGPLGVGDGLRGVTQLPAGVSLASTWNPSLAASYGKVVGSEEAGKGASVNLGPTVNILRDPRWGRTFESFTEDPYLNSALAVGEIKGVQSQGVLSQVKHYAAYNQETYRNAPADNVIVSPRALHEIYLPAFHAAVTKGKAASVMCAYSTVNGKYSCQDPFLLTHVLHQRWGFKGFVTSDYAAIHSLSAAAAGTDQEQPFATYFGQPLEQAVASGAIPESVLDTMVRRILTEMFRFGLFNHPRTGSTSAVVTTPAHQAVATSVAEAGTVLLKNKAQTLPLRSSNDATVAVIGPSASASPTDVGGGSAHVTAPFSVTPLAGIQAAAAGAGAKVVYSQGLPTDTSLAPIPSSALTPPYTGTGFGGTYTGTLTAPETGTYVLAFKNPCGCYTSTSLSLGGKDILNNPGTPPASTYSVGVHLVAGKQYQLRLKGGGPSTNLSWATPSDLAPGMAAAVAAAGKATTAVVVVSDHTETEAADRVSLDLPSAQNELVSAVAAANPHTVVVVDAGAPVAMPWIGQVAAVVDAWYPGESNGTALAAVLFGKVDPSGHLPMTFPKSLSQIPTSSPSQFPGVNGKVQYSNGIQVGYRWYDAHGVTPLFPFGYGLSYTHFSFSHLQVRPAGGPGHGHGGPGHGGPGQGGPGQGGPGQGGPAGSPQIANPVSGPGPTACHCNGQSSPLVQVSARVTNTGARAGSEVAQLYLGDPAVAGEPPRQLKGFKRVTLQPGQSTTVRFTLTGHDLSYWDSSANGWVVPDGSYKVLVGDSSALAGLPLRGSFIVSRSIGARYATVQAPSKAAPDSTFTVKAQFVNGGDYAVNGARFSLDTPPGWKVSSAGPAPHRIAAHQSVNRAFRVTVPESAQGTTAILTAELTFHQPGSGRHGRQVVATTHVTIEPAVTMTATPVSASPGHPGTTTLTFTSNLPGPAQVKVVASPPSGITVNPASTTVTVPPKGTTATLGLTVASTTPGGSYRVVLASSLVNGGHSYPLAPAQVQVTVPYASFAAAYDNTGISTDVATTAGNFDGGGESFSAQALASGTPTALTPGAKVTVGGVSLTWPDVAAGQPDNVIAEGQTIELSGSGTKLALLGSSNNGTGTGTLTVHYSDGTSQPATISVADWYANSAATGESLVTKTSHWNTASGPSGHGVSVYSNVIPLNSSKTVQSITLPDVSSGVGNSVNAMHVFAVGIG